MFKQEKALSAFTEVIINWRSFSYRQSGGLPENNRGKQFVHHHSDRHGISGKASPSLLHLSCVVLLTLPLIFTLFTKVSLLMFLKGDLGVSHCRCDQAITWTWIHELQTNNQCANTLKFMCYIIKQPIIYVYTILGTWSQYVRKWVSIWASNQEAVSLAMLITVIRLPLMKLVNQ